MAMRNTRERWGWPARLLHWAMAALILFQLGLGLYMANFVDDLFARFDYTQLHKSWGFVIFTLALVRLVWRAANPAPPMPPETPGWERAAARASHVALYLLMIALPVSGWLMASASPLQDTYGVKNMVFGLFELPDPFQPGSKRLDAALKAVHLGAAIALMAVLAVHAGAALRHHFVKRDRVLMRMIRGR